MNLHRTGEKPGWELTPPDKRNIWQRIAAGTYGLATPGNALTGLGFAIAIGGLLAIIAEKYWLGLSGLAVGRLCDVADGWAAEKSGTKSPLGEAFDAIADKVITFSTLIVLGVTTLIPWWVLVCLVLPHLIILGVSGLKFVRGHG